MAERQHGGITMAVVGAVGDGDGGAGHSCNSFGEVFAIGQRFHAKLHAAAHDGLRRQLCWQVDGHKATRCDGKEHLDGFNGGVVQDGHLVAFLQAHVVEEGTLAGYNIAYLFVIQLGYRVGEAGEVTPLLLNPGHKFGKCGDELQLREFFGSKHTGKIGVIFHRNRI